MVTLLAPKGTHGQRVARRHMAMLGLIMEVVGAFTARGYEVVSLSWDERVGMTVCYTPPPTSVVLGGVLLGVTPETWRATHRAWVLALPTGLGVADAPV